MTTRIYGASDDLVEFEGDVRGEIDYYGSNKEGDPGILLVCSDGTALCARFADAWRFELLEEGVRFLKIEHDVHDEYTLRDNLPGHDEAHFHDGLKWVYVATSRWWTRVPAERKALARKGSSRS